MSHAPRYWMNETSGVLKPVIERFLNDQQLTDQEVSIFRAYIMQWIDSPAWDANPEGGGHELRMLRDAAKVVRNTTELRLWLQRAEEFGVDPL
jgi:hypothetical protein